MALIPVATIYSAMGDLDNDKDTNIGSMSFLSFNNLGSPSLQMNQDFMQAGHDQLLWRMKLSTIAFGSLCFIVTIGLVGMSINSFTNFLFSQIPSGQECNHCLHYLVCFRQICLPNPSLPQMTSTQTLVPLLDIGTGNRLSAFNPTNDYSVIQL